MRATMCRLGLLLVLCLPSLLSAQAEKVTGIGGFFFRAKDPKALALWYERTWA